MAIELSTDKVICPRCGIAFSKRKGNFPVCYGEMYRGIGYLHICKDCLRDIYMKYLSLCGDQKAAVRQTCRKLDLYWNETIFESVLAKSSDRTIMSLYLSRINSTAYAGKSYDTTLTEEGTLWDFYRKDNDIIATTEELQTISNSGDSNPEEAKKYPDPSPERVVFWGAGYTNEMYYLREQKWKYYLEKSGIPEDADLDLGTEVLLKQICNLEVDIVRDQMAGKSVEKSVAALNTLLGSLKSRPDQIKKKDELDAKLEATPMGVWIQRWEEKRPLPEEDIPENEKSLVKYVSVWFLGHLCKMLNIKNSYSQLYEDEIAKLRVERPDLDDEDDESLLYNIFSEDDEDEEASPNEQS